MKGKLIVLEGPDGSGTSKHTQMLTDRLRTAGYDVLLTAEPTDSAIGCEIREILHSDQLPSPDAVQLLFCADRAEHVASVIYPALEKGKTVICDRYTLSTIVYGSVLGLDSDWLKTINAKFPKPDLTIITLPPFEVCMERMGRRSKRDQFERDDIQRRVYDTYKQIEDPSVIFADTSRSKQEVSDKIYERVREHFEPISRETIADLG